MLVVVMMVMGTVLEAVMSRLVTILVTVVVMIVVVMSLTELTCREAHVGTARPTKADPVLA